VSSRQHWDEWARTCILASLPLGLWLLIHWLTGDHTHPTAEVARELLFFALSICSLSLSDFRRRGRSESRKYGPFAFECCVYFTVIVAVVYGAFLTGEVLRDAVIIRNAYRCSIATALIALSVGTWVQRHLRQEGSYVYR
jgi:hypothetical protein